MTANDSGETPEQLKLKLLVEETKLKQKDKELHIEEAKIKRLQLEIEKMKQEEGIESRKRMKTGCEQNVFPINKCLSSSMNDTDFYECYVRNYISWFDITSLLDDNDNFDDDMINMFEEYFSPWKSVDKLTKYKVQSTFEQLIGELFHKYDSFTSLKYLNTSMYKYLKKKTPDCSFILKNINIDKNEEREVLQDFVICIGRFKSSNMSIDSEESIGQLMRDLVSILNVQKDRYHVYGFLTNTKRIRFYRAENRAWEGVVHYYQSDSFALFNDLRETESSSIDSITTSKESTENYFNRDGWTLFINFLTMHSSFYEYSTLYIDSHEYLYGDKFNIKLKLGQGTTSMVYLLEKNKNNQSTDDPESFVIKICKANRASGHSIDFQKELEILAQLKKSSDSKNFDLFFEDIVDSSPEGKFLLFKNVLKPLESLTIIQSKQFIDIVEYLYNCCVIHRDLCPENLMLDYNQQHLKLIDFGSAITYQIDELPRRRWIEGTISYAGFQFLNSYHWLSLMTGIHNCCDYERTFDLHCAINIILCTTDDSIQERIISIENTSSFEEKVTTLLKLWKDIEQSNKQYSKLLELVNNMTEPLQFDVIKDEIEKLF